ncbi:MAG: 50S ribosomal protein L20 [Deltaproteobacteria bacterium]|jgi:large subunit ribosomal protein L20|nr:50S ribosomal protein L20 [Deltaproteobacteria bacterium]
MPRAKRGFKARRRRNRIMKHARGYYGARGRTFANAIEQVHNGWEDAYAGRRRKKREYRRLWIVRINAAARLHGLSYSKLIFKLKNASIGLDRKVLADLALSDPGGFKAVVDATA